MADAVFFFFAEFGECFRQALGDKQRIITETVSAARRLDNPAFAGAAEKLRLEFRLVGFANGRSGFGGGAGHRSKGDNTTKTRGPFRGWNFREQPQEFGVVVRIRAVAVHS